MKRSHEPFSQEVGAAASAGEPAAPTDLFVVQNPSAGMRRPERLRQRIEAALSARRVPYEHAYTNAAGHGPELVAGALARGFRRFLVVGGDGTVREAVTALAGSDASLALLPVGTGNQLAANLGVPRRFESSLTTAIDGHLRKIDLGLVNGKPFASIVGAGLDTEIVRPPPRIKRRVGYLAYVHAAAVAAFSPKPALIRIELENGDSFSARGLGVEIMNMPGLTAPGLPRPVPVVPWARMDDGKLDGCLFATEGTLGCFAMVGAILTRRYEKSPRLEYFSGKRIVVHTDPPLRTQADGELLGETPFEVSVWPLALNVMVPGR